MRKTSALLLLLTLMLPTIALADTQYTNEAMRLHLAVPARWEIENRGPLDTIRDISSKSTLTLAVIGTPDAKRIIPFLNPDMLIITASAMGLSRDIQVLSYFSHASGDSPIAGMVFTYWDSHVPMSGAAWIYPSASDTVASALLTTPVDDPPDVSWFTDALDALFPALSAADDTQYINEAMRLSLPVPDGWMLEDLGSLDSIKNSSAKGVLMIAALNTPDAKPLLATMSQDVVALVFASQMGGDDIQVLSYVNHASADQPIVSMAFAFASSSRSMNGLVYLFSLANDTLNIIIAATPADDPQDMAWLTDVIAERFPELSVAE